MIKIKRETKYEKRYHSKMGELLCKVTRIYKTFLGIKFKKLHAYRENFEVGSFEIESINP